MQKTRPGIFVSGHNHRQNLVFFFGIVFPLFGILQIMGVKQKPGEMNYEPDFYAPLVKKEKWMEIFRVLLLNGIYIQFD